MSPKLKCYKILQILKMSSKSKSKSMKIQKNGPDNLGLVYLVTISYHRPVHTLAGVWVLQYHKKGNRVEQYSEVYLVM